MDAFPITGNYNLFLSGWLFFLETDFVIKLFVFILFLSNDYQCGSVQSFDGSFIAITVESDFKFVSGNAPGEVLRIGSASWYIFVCSATVVLKGVHIFGIGLVPFFFLTFVYLISFTPGRFPSTYNECLGISGNAFLVVITTSCKANAQSHHYAWQPKFKFKLFHFIFLIKLVLKTRQR